MVVDSSAIVAILLGEDEGPDLLRHLDSAGRLFMSSFSWFETSVVIESKKGAEGSRLLNQFFSMFAFEFIPFDTGQAEIAMDAWRRYGKGRHKAGLNLGDCASYALARTLNRPLLFKGDDFPFTDVARME
ncbi:MAG: ribonuclease [Treponema sp. GWA1_62_8]|nr:MAG: ribonuclease [Treponema sp. GWA1_62_8]